MKTYNAIFYDTLNNKQHIKMGNYNNHFRFIFSFRGILYIFIVFKSSTLNLSLVILRVWSLLRVTQDTGGLYYTLQKSKIE